MSIDKTTIPITKWVVYGATTVAIAEGYISEDKKWFISNLGKMPVWFDTKEQAINSLKRITKHRLANEYRFKNLEELYEIQWELEK